MYLNHIILGLGTFFSINVMSRGNHALRRGIRKPHKLKVSFYEVHMTELEKYLAIFPSSKASKIGEIYLNKIILYSILNGQGVGF